MQSVALIQGGFVSTVDLDDSTPKFLSVAELASPMESFQLIPNWNFQSAIVTVKLVKSLWSIIYGAQNCVKQPVELIVLGVQGVFF